ncbi:ribonuclease HII [Bacillus coahuilensis]|uniref:ribonuclease HII n=1 Tax=Bacillus coahuilensis TaxID=408580 RepID=UPI0001850E89|nr:ribonuclease HII [Bacillus coahuilensis]
MNIKEIQQKLLDINDPSAPIFEQLKHDERKGVQSLLSKWYRQYEQKQKDHLSFIQKSQYEKKLWEGGIKRIAGVDEVGRGPLAGPVVAAAVILPQSFYYPGLDDSKKLTESKKEEMFDYINATAISVSVSIINHDVIDTVNIYEATKLAMQQAINGLDLTPEYLLIDAMKLSMGIEEESIIKGDSKSISIAAASIIAKVTRDRLMKEYATTYPHYAFERNMGYGTTEHLEGLKSVGPSPIHRRSFAPIKELIQ